jgi:hypothetical protein
LARIFAAYSSIESGRREYGAFKEEVARCGREPEHVKVTQLINTVVAATEAEAEDKWADIEKLPLEIDAMSLLSKALNFDFARKGMDDAFTSEELQEMSGLQAIRDHVIRVSGKINPTVPSVKVKEPKEPDCRKRSRGAKVGQALLQPCKTRTAQLVLPNGRHSELWLLGPAPNTV